MNILDLFCGLKGWSQAFADRGHRVVSVDILAKFEPSICADILTLSKLDFEEYGRFDVVLASPPCECFSVASIYRHWDKDSKMPKDERTIGMIKLVTKTIELIHELKPRFWVMENPRGMLRKIIGLPHAEITYCQYGEHIMKPTDIWGRMPRSFKPLKCSPGSLCHERAMRGSKRGTQGIIKNRFYNSIRSAELRSKIPYGLSLAVCLACEKELSEPILVRALRDVK